jgi:hypothetical protein
MSASARTALTFAPISPEKFAEFPRIIHIIANRRHRHASYTFPIDMTDTTYPQTELEKLDRAWKTRRKPAWPAARVLIISAFTVVFGALWMVVTGTAGAPRHDILIGLWIVLIGIVNGLVFANKAATYREAERAYLRQRQTLLRIHAPNSNA